MAENKNSSANSIGSIDYSQMTDYVEGTRLDDNPIESTEDNSLTMAEALLQVANNLVIAANSIMEGQPISQSVMENIDEASTPFLSTVGGSNQQFQVPFNPLSPPDYAEILDYSSVQYLNGFLRTQIGKYVKITSLLGSVGTSDAYGFLIGVGTNYVILQELSTSNIITLDFYSIKSVYCYYSYSPSPISSN